MTGRAPLRAYLAGPEVFLPDAAAQAARKIAICARHGISAASPLDEPETLRTLPPDAAWLAIFRNCLAMMAGCDLVIANLTPYRGASADAGTLVELGWFLGQGRPVYGYSNCARPFAERCRHQHAALPEPVAGLVVETFGLPDNLMVPGAALAGGGLPIMLPEDGQDRKLDALDVFERCVALVAAQLGASPD
jgi:nucleoside 2-deoxyribosyltransferase